MGHPLRFIPLRQVAPELNSSKSLQSIIKPSRLLLCECFEKWETVCLYLDKGRYRMAKTTPKISINYNESANCDVG